VSTPDFQARPQLASSARTQTDRLTGQTVLLFPEGIIELNETSAAILARCDGIASIADIIADLANEYEVDGSELEADVWEFLETLRSKQLLQMK
jgi:pyrroloquinoline quinone biosynthesis protein D